MTGEELNEEPEEEQGGFAGDVPIAGETEEKGKGPEAEPGKRVKPRSHWIWLFRNGIGMLVVTVAAAILLETLFFPVIQIFGSSMASALHEGDFVVAIRYVPPKRGDIVAFYSGDKVLVKRVIALPGEQIDLDESGMVYIDGVQLGEPYLEETAFGGCDIGLPCQVPEGAVFVMGDNRSVSVDSRSSSVGCIREGQLVGKIICRIWPLGEAGIVK